jgi:hypothetical protein
VSTFVHGRTVDPTITKGLPTEGESIPAPIEPDHGHTIEVWRCDQRSRVWELFGAYRWSVADTGAWVPVGRFLAHGVASTWEGLYGRALADGHRVYVVGDDRPAHDPYGMFRQNAEDGTVVVHVGEMLDGMTWVDIAAGDNRFADREVTRSNGWVPLDAEHMAQALTRGRTGEQ